MHKNTKRRYAQASPTGTQHDNGNEDGDDGRWCFISLQLVMDRRQGVLLLQDEVRKSGDTERATSMPR